MQKTKKQNKATSLQPALDERNGELALWDAIAKLCPSWVEKDIQQGIAVSIKDDSLSAVWAELAALTWTDQIWWYARRSPLAPRERMPGRALTHYKIFDAIDETLQGPGGPTDLLYDMRFVDMRRELEQINNLAENAAGRTERLKQKRGLAIHQFFSDPANCRRQGFGQPQAVSLLRRQPLFQDMQIGQIKHLVREAVRSGKYESNGWVESGAPKKLPNQS